ncbi:MAG TPA: M50 family metallopeptidase [Acidimicrobiia bacterium]
MKDPLAEVDVPASRTGLIVLLLAGALILAAILSPSVAATVAVLLALILMIVLHEFGHFVMAKRSGMKVTEFFVGFGPRLWSFKRGETEYGVKPFILGGYCRIVGMNNLDEVPPEDADRAYRAKPFHQRLGVAVAGSTVHFMIAIILMFFVLWMSGTVKPTTTLDGVATDSAAAHAQLKAGEKIVAIDGQQVTSWNQVKAAVSSHHGKPIAITVVDKNGIERTANATPQYDSDVGRYVLGITAKEHLTPLSLPSAVTHSFSEVYTVGRLSVGGLVKMFSPSGVHSYTNQLSGNNTPATAPPTHASGSGNQSGGSDQPRFISLIGIGRLASQAVQAGWVTVLGLLISINVFVGIFNMIPLLPFDGGLVAIAIYEKVASTIRGRKVEADVRKLIPITAVVVAVLLFIGISAMFLDIVHPQQNPF